jgi:Zn finger protein HypA/HybF involved in hydrogenase expression
MDQSPIPAPVPVVKVQGRCMKCKEQRDMEKTEEVVMKNGMRALKGECGKCGTKMFKILGKAK